MVEVSRASKHVNYEKKKEQMLKQSVCTTLDFFSHLPSIINHHARLSCFMQLFNRMTAQQVLVSCDPVTLSEHQGKKKKKKKNIQTWNKL